jgi:hypothetical protein
VRPVTVLILHPPAPPEPTEAVRWLVEARERIAERHLALFEAAGADTVRIVSDDSGAPISFGERLRGLAREIADTTPRGRHGLVLIGSGAMPLARQSDLEEFVRVARSVSRRPVALANSYYSADAIALPDVGVVLGVPDLPSDNALPRWLSERAGIPVRDRRHVWRLGIDVDSPLDVLLVAGDPGCPPPLRSLATQIAAGAPDVVEAIRAVGATLEDRRAELLLAGRSSARTLQWLERRAACRVRALIEERGMRSSTTLALGDLDEERDEPPAVPAETIRFGPPRSVLGLLLDESGPRMLPVVVQQLGDAAILDTRVLIAHRHGLDERRWPPLEDRLASDMLRPGDIEDPWLRQITRRALDMRTPILLGGHTLAGPGLPLIPGVVRWLDTPDEPGEAPALELHVQDEAELVAMIQAEAEPGTDTTTEPDEAIEPEAGREAGPEPEPVGAGAAPTQPSLWDA